MAQTKVFSDINLDFIPHPVTGDLPKLYDANAVKRSVRNLVLTNPYEHPYDFRVGSGVRQLLFENAGPEAFVAIKERIQYVIEAHEPRVELISITVDGDSAELVDRNEIAISIRFFVGSSTNPEEVSIFLERVR